MYSIRRGRGPTKLISPFITFHSWGISSRLERRSRRPKVVSRSLSESRLPSASLASFMLRNLWMTKGRACRPGRLCWKRAGRPMVTLTSTQTTSITGPRMGSSSKEPTRSKARLVKRYKGRLWVIDGSSGGSSEYIGGHGDGVVHVLSGQGRVDQEHQAGLPQFAGHWKGVLGPKATLSESLLEIDFAAAAAEAGNVPAVDLFH